MTQQKPIAESVQAKTAIVGNTVHVHIDADTHSSTERQPWRLTIDAPLDNFTSQQIDEIFTLICKLSGDPTLRLVRVVSGSTVFILDGSESGYKRIAALFDSGELSNAIGAKVLAVEIVLNKSVEIEDRRDERLENAVDSDVVVREFATRHLQYAKDIEDAASMGWLMDGTAEEGEAVLPKKLGDFRILREISHGGMGIICEAIQEPLNRRVAVKILRRGHISPEHRQRFLREQEILGNLHQTNNVSIFAAGEEGPIQYFAMQFIDGAPLNLIVRTAYEMKSSNCRSKMPTLKNLASLLKGKKNVLQEDSHSSTASFNPNRVNPSTPKQIGDRLTPSEMKFSLSREYFQSVAEVMAQVAESLHHVHKHDIIHCDLKPGNIMVDTTGQSWLIDFGLAASVESEEERASLPANTEESNEPAYAKGASETPGYDGLGTPGYIAPERYEQRPADVRTDIWGLGTTLYELLTLRRAFPQSLDLGTTTPNSSLCPIRPRQLVANLPRDLEAICSKAMQPQSEKRYVSAEDFAADLRRWLRGEPTMAYPAFSARRVYLWACRNKGWVSVILVLMLSLVVLCILAVILRR